MIDSRIYTSTVVSNIYIGLTIMWFLQQMVNLPEGASHCYLNHLTTIFQTVHS